jgi:hypothetical protein
MRCLFLLMFSVSPPFFKIRFSDIFLPAPAPFGVKQAHFGVFTTAIPKEPKILTHYT